MNIVFIDLSDEEYAKYISDAPKKTSSAIVAHYHNNPRPKEIYYAPAGFCVARYLHDMHPNEPINMFRSKETGLITFTIGSHSYEITYSH